MSISQNQQYATTLKQLVGRVLSIKPNTPPTIAGDFINDAIRVISDRKPMWTGSMDWTPIEVPAIINDGTVSVSYHSKTITGTAGTWPFADQSNTTIPAGITRLGLQTVVPALMNGIKVNTPIYVSPSPGDSNAEIVIVKSVTDTSFTANFTKFQNANVPLTISSLVNRQFRVGGQTKPIYTIVAVPNATTLILDNFWDGTAVSGGSYEIWKSFYVLDPAIKSLVSVTDPTQGIPPIKVNVPAGYLDVIDPQRTATGYPQAMAPRGPDQNGNMQYELWPKATSARQLVCRFYRQPPPMLNDGDYVPALLNPTLLFMYATSMALRTKVGLDDAFYSPGDSMAYMKMFEDQYNAMCIADDAKNHTDGSWRIGAGGVGGANYAQNHAVSADGDWSMY